MSEHADHCPKCLRPIAGAEDLGIPKPDPLFRKHHIGCGTVILLIILWFIISAIMDGK